MKYKHLPDQKYNTWEWNYGYSPAYHYSHHIKELSCELETNGGIITKASIYNNISLEHYTLLEKRLNGVKHQQEEIDKVFSN